MLNVFYTVDTEVWPGEAPLEAALQRDIDGATPQGRYGVGYQMDVLDAHGLKGVFFVEALFACAVGLEPLRRIVEPIQARGHEVQLHVHSEWLERMPAPILGERRGQFLMNFTEEEQLRLLDQGLQNLRACGAANVSAFRAGSFGADLNTLRCLNRLGIAYDSSYNRPYLGTQCGLEALGTLVQPARVEGVLEYPITFFQDLPGHYRPVHLNACSISELKRTLEEAWGRGWSSYVIVSHSFELIRRNAGKPTGPAADPIVIRRFEQLCRFLGENRHLFRTAGFAGLDPSAAPNGVNGAPLRSTVTRTLGRLAQQALRRLS
jgi:hypothetical protein